MLKHRNKNKGFTLIEVIVTTTIIAMLAAFAVPTFIGYIEEGNQAKRMNIAKTIYLAAQNQLTEKKINQTLATFSMTEDEADAKIKADATFIKPDEFANGVLEKGSSILPSAMPADEKANIVYISKPQGTTSGKVYDLLDSVIQDKSVLNNAILIEYNKATGFVLSVFYSEETGGIDESKFTFTYDKPKTEDKIDKYKSVSGIRPYTLADERRQGYCGIEETGMLPPTDKDVVINIRDGKKYPLSDGTGGSYENVLYAEVLIPKSMVESGQTYNLQVFSENGELLKLQTKAGISKPYETGLISLDKLPNTVDLAVQNKTNENIIFRQIFNEDSSALPEYADNKDYAKIIWVLDYVNGDMLSQNNSIGLKISPQNIRAGISGDGINVKSLSVQNSHFAYEIQDKSIALSGKSKSFITSARHLNNVRYKLDGDFRQLEDIDMTQITNFLPIGSAIKPAVTFLAGKAAAPFEGKYFARKEAGTYSIKNLKIDTTLYEVPENTGLFGAIKGPKILDWSKGVVTGLTLENPSIKGKDNVGALTGSNSGQISMVTVMSTDINPTNIVVKGADNVGGVAGLSSGKISDVSFISASSKAAVFGDSAIGGIAGNNLDKGDIKNVLYLAVAPKNEEKITPIAGMSSGTINDAIYLSGEAIRPTPITAQSDNSYNTAIANFGMPKSTKNIYQDKPWNGWMKTDGISNPLDTSSTAKYPYPYQVEVPSIDNWPVADESGGVASLAYYELYSDNTWGYSNSKNEPIRSAESLEKDDKDVTVINDGYCIEYFNASGSYEVTVGTLKLSSSNWKWNDKIIDHTQNIRPVEFIKDIDGKKMNYMRLFLNNEIIESQANGAAKIDIVLKKGSMDILKTQFNPLFAPSTINESFNIRSPRQLDNVDKADDRNFLQNINIDFGAYDINFEKKSKYYARELESVNYKNEVFTLNSDTRISTAESIVDVKKDKGNGKGLPFSGEYNGNNKYIKNVKVDGDGINNNGQGRINIGLFSEVSGNVHNVVLLRSNFEDKQIMGGIAGTLKSGGIIQNCELSDVVIKNNGTGSGKGIGGIVGENEGTVENVYFNSTYRDEATGVYSAPIITEKNNTKEVGGLVGINRGVISNAYTTAVGPNKKPTIGTGKQGNNENNIYYLKGSGYNDNVDSSQGIGMTSGELRKAIEDKKIDVNFWERAKADATDTKDTETLNGQAYPFPKIKGMNHYFDWPMLTSTLKYYEKYSNGKYGYFYYTSENTPVDSLEYNPDITVVEEGYLVELLSSGTYYIKFDGSQTAEAYSTEVYDNRNVIRFKHSKVEPLIVSSKMSDDGVKPVKLEVSPSPMSFNNILSGAENNKNMYFNPLFAKQIFIDTEAKAQKTLELRSPRQMLNVETVSQSNTTEEFQERVYDDYSVDKPSRIKTVYLKDIDTKFPYGNSYETADKSSSTFKFEDSYKDETPYYKTRCFNYSITPSYSGSRTISTTTAKNSLGQETVTEVVEYYTVKNEVHKYTMENLETEWKWNSWYYIAYRDNAYWELNSETEDRTAVRRVTTVTTKSTNQIKFNLKQTISINFYVPDEVTPSINRPVYIWEMGYNSSKAVISNNIISKLISDYDAGVYDKTQKPVFDEYGRIKRNRIYNLVMNVTSQGSAPYSENTGGAFGTVAEGVIVKNLEFVDPQIRYDSNGRGGGIVTNTNLGTIDNVQVYNKEYTRSLFANSSGNTDTDTVFCHSGSSSTNNYGHNHGGIAGQSAGPNAKITNCIVGTNANTADKIANNKTLITCYQKDRYDGEWATTRVGGIVGFVYGESKIISCINIAKIDARWTNDTIKTSRRNSPYSLGGIAGATGLRSNTPAVSYISGYSKPSPGYIVGCYNAGTLTLKNGWVAGITGYPATGSEIISCYNTGRINVEGTGTQLTTTVPLDDQPLRIGGISGEPDECTIKNCYNIGYVSKECLPTKGTKPDNSAAGAIMALPAYSNSTLENCYSLAADQFRPIGIVGKLYSSNPPSSVNGFKTNAQLVANFTTWQSRDNLRNNKELVSDKHINLFPATENYWKYRINGSKGYPVFKLEANSFYIYPQLAATFEYNGIGYRNPHITPWEYIDSEYDSTLMYYEKYDEENFGYYNLDIMGNPHDSLRQDKSVIQDGYFIETGKEGIKYRIELNGVLWSDVLTSTNNIIGTKTGIALTPNMVSELDKNAGYDKIRVYTIAISDEDNKVNRLIGTNTISTLKKGKDIYFDSLFPKEIKYATTESETVELDRTKLKLAAEQYYIRSPKHMDNISKLIQVKLSNGGFENKSIGRTFVQELNLDFANYGTPSYKPFAAISSAVVRGEFAGNYDGGGKDILGIKIVGNEDSRSIGLFQNIASNATIGNLRLVNPSYESKLSSGIGLGDIFNMGSVSAINMGTIQKIAVEKPTFVLVSGTNVTKNIGGITGTNIGNLNDVYIVSENSVSPIHFISGTVNSGGIAGGNNGKIDKVLYLAVAPTTNSKICPIVSINEIKPNIQNKITDAYFLSADNYNKITESDGTIGTAKTTEQFTSEFSKSFIPSKIIDWYNWIEPKGQYANPYPSPYSYQYPFIYGIRPPQVYPIANNSN